MIFFCKSRWVMNYDYLGWIAQRSIFEFKPPALDAGHLNVVGIQL
jgi:hypothetical protein